MVQGQEVPACFIPGLSGLTLGSYHSPAVCSHTMEPLCSANLPLYIGNGLENSSRSMLLRTGHDSKLFTCIFSLNPHTNLYEGKPQQ